MSNNATRFAFVLAMGMGMAVSACGGQIGDPAGDDGDEGNAESFSAVTAVVGGRAEVTASSGLNLRATPSTSARIILTMPHGATVDVLAKSGSWFSVKYNSSTGWAYGEYLSAMSSGGGGPDPAPTGAVADAIDRARSGLGFSYHWGGGCWSPGSSSKGACYGSCPDCTHSGTWGADCSGYVSKIWQVPGAEALTHCSHPYSTTTFYDTHPYWHDVPRSNAMKGDAFVRHGHIFIFDSGDPWGSMTAFEAKGCSYGIVHDNRTADSSYKVIRRNGY